MSSRPGAPATYTHGHHESVLRSHAWRTVANSAAYLEAELVPGRRVLDVGSGPGTITVDIAERVAPGRVVGVDAAEVVVEQARALAAERGVDTVEFVVADVFALPFDDDSFDVVHAHQVLQHVGDPVAALREMRRVTVPGGAVAAREVDYHGTVWAPASAGLDRWMDVYQQVHRGNGGEPDAGRALRGWALEAGFTDVSCTASSWCFSTDDERTWWGDSWAARATESAFAADAVARGVATAAELEAIADAWRAWRDAPDGVLMMPHGEMIARA
ncbi:methyltransferase domain-containing protein [Frigoribacterium sp. CFBP 13707]|uniref:methyltransferase domain-containing protein n=1 Tax=Frigoribacterium sp. CFBP 13707 TaxID=2775313 RepID=UPI0017835C84|nr:methyltransferase domain-containing protein [Frigoribacterium sp. CFBP 13707]MBD8726358.1 methyltransferase domain-containing protein [Frigoribacterium sp. CFBP 13707]